MCFNGVMHPQSQPSYHAQSHCWLLEIKAPENKWMKNQHMIKNKLFTSSSQKKKKRSEGWVLEIYPSTVNWRANVKSIGLCISVSVVGEWVLWVVNVMGISWTLSPENKWMKDEIFWRFELQSLSSPKLKLKVSQSANS